MKRLTGILLSLSIGIVPPLLADPPRTQSELDALYGKADPMEVAKQLYPDFAAGTLQAQAVWGGTLRLGPERWESIPISLLMQSYDRIQLHRDGPRDWFAFKYRQYRADLDKQLQAVDTASPQEAMLLAKALLGYVPDKSRPIEWEESQIDTQIHLRNILSYLLESKHGPVREAARRKYSQLRSSRTQEELDPELWKTQEERRLRQRLAEIAAISYTEARRRAAEILKREVLNPVGGDGLPKDTKRFRHLRDYYLGLSRDEREPPRFRLGVIEPVPERLRAQFEVLTDLPKDRWTTRDYGSLLKASEQLPPEHPFRQKVVALGLLLAKSPAQVKLAIDGAARLRDLGPEVTWALVHHAYQGVNKEAAAASEEILRNQRIPLSEIFEHFAPLLSQDAEALRKILEERLARPGRIPHHWAPIVAAALDHAAHHYRSGPPIEIEAASRLVGDRGELREPLIKLAFHSYGETRRHALELLTGPGSPPVTPELEEKLGIAAATDGQPEFREAAWAAIKRLGLAPDRYLKAIFELKTDRIYDERQIRRLEFLAREFPKDERLAPLIEKALGEHNQWPVKVAAAKAARSLLQLPPNLEKLLTQYAIWEDLTVSQAAFWTLTDPKFALHSEAYQRFLGYMSVETMFPVHATAVRERAAQLMKELRIPPERVGEGLIEVATEPGRRATPRLKGIQQALEYVLAHPGRYAGLQELIMAALADGGQTVGYFDEGAPDSLVIAVYRLAFRAMAVLPSLDSSLRESLFTRLNSLDPAKQIDAMIGLAPHGFHTVDEIARVAVLAGSTDKEVRERATDLLQRNHISEETALGARLDDAIRRRDPQTASARLLGLAKDPSSASRFPEKISRLIALAFESEVSKVRQDVAHAVGLAAWNTLAIQQALIEREKSDKDPAVRQAAAWAFRQVTRAERPAKGGWFTRCRFQALVARARDALYRWRRIPSGS